MAKDLYQKIDGEAVKILDTSDYVKNNELADKVNEQLTDYAKLSELESVPGGFPTDETLRQFAEVIGQKYVALSDLTPIDFNGLVNRIILLENKVSHLETQISELTDVN